MNDGECLLSRFFVRVLLLAGRKHKLSANSLEFVV